MPGNQKGNDESPWDQWNILTTTKIIWQAPRHLPEKGTIKMKMIHEAQMSAKPTYQISYFDKKGKKLKIGNQTTSDPGAALILGYGHVRDTGGETHIWPDDQPNGIWICRHADLPDLPGPNELVRLMLENFQRSRR
jgi:hypothetical protein